MAALTSRAMSFFAGGFVRCGFARARIHAHDGTTTEDPLAIALWMQWGVAS